MPLVRVTLRKGRSSEFLRDAGNAIHEALVAQANVPQDDRFQIFDEVEADRLIAHPSYGGVERSENLMIIEITLNAGRTVEIKKNLSRTSPRDWNGPSTCGPTTSWSIWSR